MSVSDGMVFLGSFIITYNFAEIQEAFTSTDLFIGFLGGIAVLGWFYQLLFMPETKDMTLEQIDELISVPTRQLVREDWTSSVQTFAHLAHFRFGEASKGFRQRRESVVVRRLSSVDFGDKSKAAGEA